MCRFCLAGRHGLRYYYYYYYTTTTNPPAAAAATAAATATATTTTPPPTTTTARSINSTREFRASTFRALSARYARLRFVRVPRMLFCAGSARVAAFKFLKEINILRRILLLGNLYIITLGTLRTFTWKTWEPWGNLYNTALGTLTTFTWETWESWGNLYNATSESLRKPWQYNLGTLENLLQCNLGNLEGTFTIQPWEAWKTWEPSGNFEETLKEPWGYLLGTLREPWQSNLGNLLETFTMSPWEPGPRLLGNLYIIILGTLTTFTWKTWEPCREPWRNLEGTFWEPFGNLEGTLRNLGNLGNLEGTLGTLGTFTWEPGNLYLGTWEPLLGNLYLGTWEPLLGNLYLGTFTWNLGTLGEWVSELLRSAPKPLLWLKTPKHSAVGESWGFNSVPHR